MANLQRATVQIEGVVGRAVCRLQIHHAGTETRLIAAEGGDRATIQVDDMSATTAGRLELDIRICIQVQVATVHIDCGVTVIKNAELHQTLGGAADVEGAATQGDGSLCTGTAGKSCS